MGIKRVMVGKGDYMHMYNIYDAKTNDFLYSEMYLLKKEKVIKIYKDGHTTIRERGDIKNERMD